MASVSLYREPETNLMSDRKVIELLSQLKSAKAHGKITHTPLWMTLNRVPKKFRISKNDSRLCRIPKPADSKSWGIPEFCKALNGFSWNSRQNSQNFGPGEIHGFPVRLTEHILLGFQCRSWMGGVWISSRIAQ